MSRLYGRFEMEFNGCAWIPSKTDFTATHIGSVSEGDEKMAEEGLEVTLFVLLCVRTVHIDITLFDQSSFFFYDIGASAIWRNYSQVESQARSSRANKTIGLSRMH